MVASVTRADGILWIRRQHRFIRCDFSLHIGGKFVVRGRRDFGLIQAARHADAVVLLAGDGDAQRLRQSTRARRRLGDLARFHLGSFGIEADFAGWSEGVQRFCRDRTGTTPDRFPF